MVFFFVCFVCFFNSSPELTRLTFSLGNGPCVFVLYQAVVSPISWPWWDIGAL